MLMIVPPEKGQVKVPGSRGLARKSDDPGNGARMLLKGAQAASEFQVNCGAAGTRGEL